MPDSKTNEFSRPIVLTQIGEKETHHTVAAEPAECAALAARLGLLALARLQGRVALRRLRGGKVLRIAGHLSSEVTQACVVTLKPVAAAIEDDFVEDIALIPPGTAGEPELSIDPEAEDEPEMPGPELLSEGGALDLGELLVQLLAERLDPYPRSPGVDLGEATWGADAAASEEKARPFADLERKLQRR